MMMTTSIRLMASKVPGRAPPAWARSRSSQSRIIAVVTFLVGEWIPAWLFMSIAFLVATLGVVGLGWWVLKGDAQNRRFDQNQGE